MDWTDIMKKVIFISGAEFSGTTFFHMILANDPHGLAVGEAHNMMRPSVPYHFDMHCSCGEHPCGVWQQLKSNGEEQLYQSIFTMFPELEYIVDSSGDPFWIRDQKAYLRQQGIATQDIVIWKSPYEFAQSHFKRDSLRVWERSWTVYHRLFYTFFGQWPAVSYARLVEDRQLLRDVCDYLGIDDFEGKELFWERPQHVVGGNPSARVHLYSQDSEQFKENVQRSSSKIDVAKDGSYRSIYHEVKVVPEVQKSVDAALKTNPQILEILDLLEARNLRGGRYGGDDYETLRIPTLFLQLRQLKYWSVRRLANMRYGS